MSREAMLFMNYEHYGKCKGSFKDSQKKCKYLIMKLYFYLFSNVFINIVLNANQIIHFECKNA